MGKQTQWHRPGNAMTLSDWLLLLNNVVVAIDCVATLGILWVMTKRR